jgi:SAM-dependent methyltransferase
MNHDDTDDMLQRIDLLLQAMAAHASTLGSGRPGDFAKDIGLLRSEVYRRTHGAGSSPNESIELMLTRLTETAPTAPLLANVEDLKLLVNAAGWDAMYAADVPAGWDLGRPQPAFVRLADLGLFRGQVLDAGCGTGEHAMLAATGGADAIGIDVSPHAIRKARCKAAERRITVRFEVADALRLERLGKTFDTVIDSALFHGFDDNSRARYVRGLESVTRPGSWCYLVCYSDRQLGDVSPRRVSQDEIRDAFTGGWAVTRIMPETYELNTGYAAQAWLAAVCRT